MSLPQSSYDAVERTEVLPLLPASAQSFLDIGCARGGFGRAIRRERGPSVRIVGLEPIAEQAADARSAGYDEVLEGYFPEVMAHSEELFDCIVLNDVLEHMMDPWTAVSGVKSRLAPGGRVVASIPSIQFLPIWLKVLRGRWDYTDEGTLDRTHVRFFTRATMVEMFEGAGYTVERAQGINSMTTRGHARLLAPLAWLFGNARFLQFVIVAGAKRLEALG
ncbi:MAG: class I SAM-dependent methyltransferase [Rhodoglobus sp.]